MSGMLVGVNAVHWTPDAGIGEEQYLRVVLAKMRDLQPDTQYVIFTDPANHAVFKGWDRVCIDAPDKVGVLGGNADPLERVAKQRGIDLFFSPLDTTPAFSAIPFVLFALSLRRWERAYLKQHRLQSVRRRTVKRLCNAAAAIVGPSEFVQRRFLELLDIPLDRVIVAPLGVHPAFGRPQPCMAEQPYLLTVGDTCRFKNISRLLQAMARLEDKIGHNLVVVGRPGDAEPSEWGPRVIRIEQCPTTYLAGLYQHCDVFVLPSLYESSGLTVLEAMRSGALVATARTGGIVEVAGDTPIFFNPESVHSIVGAIRRGIEEDPAQRLSRVKYGRQVAAEFTWEKCAWKTLSAFKRV